MASTDPATVPGVDLTDLDLTEVPAEEVGDQGTEPDHDQVEPGA
ncbi:hypothetical protein EDD28_2467 [Salana multivorans]|uniref:Uncharacterized protein n=1 Tax=Salana multivorans TaxID=120377 RepID=A0A3N2DDN6_9MICO|nr:hypothetical protein [Salana multivorans]ROR97778.1 hypothetical protein EDD28_2386 [Salana multivorans]ROR97857.1 hypothetical protein EDD28_2467 [Salana multivorans]